MKFVYRTKQLLLVFGDLVSFTLGFLMSLTVRFFQLPDWPLIESHAILFGIVFFLWIVVNYINGLYDLGKVGNDRIFYRRFGETVIISLIVGVVFFYLLPTKSIAPKTILLLTIAFGYGLSAIWRYLYNKFLGAKKLQTNIILVGVAEETKELVKIIENDPGKGYRIVSIIDPDHTINTEDYPNFDIFHGLHTTRPAINTKKAQLVVIASHLHQNPEALRELYQLLFWNIRIVDSPSFYEIITGRITPAAFSEAWFLEHLKNTDYPIYDKFRTLLDYIAGLSVGLIFVLTFPFVAIAIKLDSKGPMFFKQKRIGKNGKIFWIYKYRSMNTIDDKDKVEDSIMNRKDDKKRITRVGKIIRKTRIDELPQFINLLKRDVSLIGPRPECPELNKEFEEQLPYYTLRQIVRPGLTGWAVIQQGYTETMEDSLKKLQYDLYYIKNRSALLDLSILLRTVNVVVRFMGQ